MEIKNSVPVEATLIANDFIDRLMAGASGEYVKVYLYVLRHQQEKLELDTIAEALGHTESDVRRALLYWERAGALKDEAGTVNPQTDGTAARPETSRTSYSPERAAALSEDEDFSQLLYIAQKYMNKIFTHRECEVFAYLYDGLRMPSELLEYLVEYCVQCGHSSIRYIETVAQSWHERGVRTVEEAKACSSGYSKDSFAVMKAFGLGDRRPGSAEKEMIERWFGTYGFSRELVLEACNRALQATHSPSFRYADKILAEWKKAGVKTPRDVAALDEKYHKRAAGRQDGRAAVKKTANQFHNFEQRDTDYDSMVLDQVKSWINEG